MGQIIIPLKKLKELLSDTLVYGISNVLARFINYLLVPLHTYVFTTAEYGIVNLVFASIGFLWVIFTFGMESAYLRYANKRDDAKDVYKTIQLGLGLLASLLVVLLIVMAPLLMPLMSLVETGSQNLYWMMLGILWFDTMAIVPFAELRLARRSWLFAALKIVNVLVLLSLNYYLILVQGWGIEAIFFANVIASGIIALLCWVYTSDLFAGTWKISILRKALTFGLPFIPAGIGHVINEMLDRFFLGNYLSQSTISELYGGDLIPEDIVGIYSACYKLAVFMLLLVQMFRMAWQPFFLRHADDPEAPKLYSEVFRYFNLVAGVVFLGVALFADQIVRIQIPFTDAYLIGEDFWMGLNIVPVLLGAYWFQGWYQNFAAGIFIKEQTRILPKITLIGAAITIVANLILIPIYGMMGSAWATLISYGCMAFLLYKYSRSVYPVPYGMVRAVATLALGASFVLVQPSVAEWMSSEWISSLLLLVTGTIGFVLLTLSPFGSKVRRVA